MTKPLSKWVMKRYSKLWKKFKEEEFDHSQASDVLRDDKMTSIILSDLKKAGWLEARLHPGDSRKRIYKLKNPEEAVENLEMNK